MQLFSEFLNGLLMSNHNIVTETLGKINNVTRALNDNFTKNPEFSLQFYISMTGVLNSINGVDEINFEALQIKVREALALTNEGIAEIQQLSTLKKSIARINLKIINVIVN